MDLKAELEQASPSSEQHIYNQFQFQQSPRHMSEIIKANVMSQKAMGV